MASLILPNRLLFNIIVNPSVNMTALHIFLFGRFHVEYEKQSLISLEARKAQELFCYLLLYPNRPHFREVLADLLWRDVSAIQPKSYLRKALWQLQSALESQAETVNIPLLLIEPDWIQLNPEASFWLDTIIFERAFATVQNVPGRELTPQHAQVLKKAVNLYAGDLLEGWYADWCLYERERFRYMYLAMLDKLMNYCVAHQDYETGIVYGLQALRYDPAREHTHRQLIRLKYLAGYRTEALRQYERCVTMLAKELNVKPAQRTVALCEQIRADGLNTSDSTSSQINPAIDSSLSEILNRLQHLEDTLANLHCQIQQDIQAVKRIINGRQ